MYAACDDTRMHLVRRVLYGRIFVVILIMLFILVGIRIYRLWRSLLLLCWYRCIKMSDLIVNVEVCSSNGTLRPRTSAIE